jgi:quinol monooxygenase YgiN
MIAVTLRLVARPESRLELLRQVRENLLPPTRREPGCLSYRFYQDIEDANAFSFVEEWNDWMSLNNHFRSERVGTFLGGLGDLISEPPLARIHEVSGTRGAEAIQQARSSLAVEL